MNSLSIKLKLTLLATLAAVGMLLMAAIQIHATQKLESLDARTLDANGG